MRTDHDDIQQALHLLLAGELPPDEVARLEIHLSSCEPCATLRTRLERTNALLAKKLVATPPLPAISRDEILLMALRARQSGVAATGSAGQIATPFRRRLLAAAGLVGVLLVPAATYLAFRPPEPAIGLDPVASALDVDF